MLHLRLKQDPRMAKPKAIKSPGIHCDLLVHFSGFEVAQVASFHVEVAQKSSFKGHKVVAREDS